MHVRWCELPTENPKEYLLSSFCFSYVLYVFHHSTFVCFLRTKRISRANSSTDRSSLHQPKLWSQTNVCERNASGLAARGISEIRLGMSDRLVEHRQAMQQRQSHWCRDRAVGESIFFLMKVEGKGKEKENGKRSFVFQKKIKEDWKKNWKRNFIWHPMGVFLKVSCMLQSYCFVMVKKTNCVIHLGVYSAALPTNPPLCSHRVAGVVGKGVLVCYMRLLRNSLLSQLKSHAKAMGSIHIQIWGLLIFFFFDSHAIAGILWFFLVFTLSHCTVISR